MDALLPRLGLALAIGLLVGLERGWRERDAPDRSRTAGIRTYAISGMLGGVFAALAESLDAVSILVAGFLGFVAVFASFKAREAAFDDDFSVTGVIAGLGVFALGALAVSGDHQAAAGGGAALAGIVANASGFSGGINQDTAAGVARWLFVAFLPSGLVGFVAALKMVHGTRRTRSVAIR